MVCTLPQPPLVPAPSQMEPYILREIRESPLRRHKKFHYKDFIRIGRVSQGTKRIKREEGVVVHFYMLALI